MISCKDLIDAGSDAKAFLSAEDLSAGRFSLRIAGRIAFTGEGTPNTFID